MSADHEPNPMLMPLGDRALLVRYGTVLDAANNRAATQLTERLLAARLAGIGEIAPNLVSVLVRYDPSETTYARLAGEIGILANTQVSPRSSAQHHSVPISYGGEGGPDLDAVADQLAMTPKDFVAAHQADRLTVLAVGFAPGFVYCGLHTPTLNIPRRSTVRAQVPAGSVLFAAGQTAIAATAIPTGWSVIGRTQRLNFDPDKNPPTQMRAGDMVTLVSTQ